MPYPRAGAHPSLSLVRPSQGRLRGDRGPRNRLFNDRSRSEKPVVRRTDGLFDPRAVARRVHGDVTSMMVGGIAALLLQMLHPAVLAGVWDHSNFRSDMHGRLRPHRALHRAHHLRRAGGGGGGDRTHTRHPRPCPRDFAEREHLFRERSRAAGLGARDRDHELP